MKWRFNKEKVELQLEKKGVKEMRRTDGVIEAFLGPETSFEGKLLFEGMIRVEGKIKGEIGKYHYKLGVFLGILEDKIEICWIVGDDDTQTEEWEVMRGEI